jgi:phosphatidylethanolamine-binding protein (PEBP) family uncharacterized protein
MKRQTRKIKKTRKRKQRGGYEPFLTVHFASSNVKPSSNVEREVKLADVQEKPQVTWSQQAGPVTLICWDPDAPRPSEHQGYLHWMAINQTGTFPSGEQVPWTPPAPPHGFLHHYYFGLFKQTDGVPVTVPARYPFSLNDFVKKNGLSLITQVGFQTETKSWFKDLKLF